MVINYGSAQVVTPFIDERKKCGSKGELEDQLPDLDRHSSTAEFASLIPGVGVLLGPMKGARNVVGHNRWKW
jgi:hypothetical protein